MAHILHTPESLLPRSDSKNPATTCKGLTTNGRPCRRAIAPLSKPKRDSSSLVHPGAESNDTPSADVDENTAEAYFCWQHKNQAQRTEMEERRPNPLRVRNSVDTLISRLGVLHIADPPVVEKIDDGHTTKPRRAKVSQPRQEKSSRRSLFSLLCCGSGVEEDDDYLEVVRHKKRMSRDPRVYKNDSPSMKHMADRLPSNVNGIQAFQGSAPFAPRQDHMSGLVPPTLPLKIASQVLSEASKPISPGDKEGYIYMYWLTDEVTRSPTEVSSLLDLPSPTRHHRASEDILSPGSSVKSSSYVLTNSGKQTIIVKIGRAENVHRRLSSWQQQCGYNLTLIRFYPYVPFKSVPINTTSQDSHSGNVPTMKQSSPTIRKVPYSHRVERLIHLELSGQQVRQERCATCGKEHREWFEIQATREAVRCVDEVIRRWVSWAEQLGSADK